MRYYGISIVVALAAVVAARNTDSHRGLCQKRDSGRSACFCSDSVWCGRSRHSFSRGPHRGGRDCGAGLSMADTRVFVLRDVKGSYSTRGISGDCTNRRYTGALIFCLLGRLSILTCGPAMHTVRATLLLPCWHKVFPNY